MGERVGDGRKREREKIGTEMERLGSERQLHKIMTERGTEIIIARYIGKE